MDAIITAGGTIGPGDGLYELTGVENKALIPLAGHPMINWVADALVGSELVENIVIVGLKADEVPLSGAQFHFVDGVGGLIDNILTAIETLQEINPAAEKFLVCSSDIPLISPEIVRGFVEECGTQEADVYYAIVEEKTLEARFPASKRTFVPFREGRFSGGDLFLVDASTPAKADPNIFRALTGSRKNYWRQVRMLGIVFILKFLLKRLTVEDTAKRASKILNMEVQAVRTKYAELGMDLDKPYQYNLIKADLEKRQAQPRHV